GIDWARGSLADVNKHNKDVDSLDEGWAQTIAGMPIERAVVAGSIADEQGKFNLNNLRAQGNEASTMFRALLAGLGLSSDLAEAVTDWVDKDDDLSGSSGAENAYYLSLARPYRAANREMLQVDELYRVRGFDAD